MNYTVFAALKEASEQLSALTHIDPQRESRLLAAHSLGIGLSHLTLHLQDEMTVEQRDSLASYVARRLSYEPMSHILGYREFWGRRFRVNSDVLDPRPETEFLIEAALSRSFEKVLDIGTGSGAIAVSLMAERENARAVASDLSNAALEVAKVNARDHDVADRIDFIQSDLWQNIKGKFDLIVSNPPYISLDEMQGLDRGLEFEPRFALTDEQDGLSFYRKISRKASKYLTSQGRLIFEIGSTQGKDVAHILDQSGFKEVNIIQDFDNRDRIVLGVLQ